MDVPRLGVESELQLQAYTAAHGNARSLTHWGGQGSDLCPHGHYLDLFPLHHSGNSHILVYTPLLMDTWVVFTFLATMSNAAVIADI